MMQRWGQDRGVGFAMAAQLRIAPGGLGFGVDGVLGLCWDCGGVYKPSTLQDLKTSVSIVFLNFNHGQ